MLREPPSAERVARFRTGLFALGVSDGTIGIAVSGGADSLALLLLAAASFPQVKAATIDHGLRPEAADEAAHVASICRTLEIPHRILTPPVPRRASIQAQARQARYQALARWQEEEGVDWVLTAHHADDQAETLLMRLLRGSGIAGLAGIRPVSILAGARVGRPLLGWRRVELAAIVAAAGLQPVDDPSNRDERHDRTRIRRRLAENDWIDVEALARSAAALGRAEQALEEVAARLAGERIAAEGEALTLDPSGLPDELLRRLVLAALRRIAPDAEPRGAELVALVARLRGGATATLAGVRCTGGACFRFAPAPPRNKLNRGG